METRVHHDSDLLHSTEGLHCTIPYFTIPLLKMLKYPLVHVQIDGEEFLYDESHMFSPERGYGYYPVTWDSSVGRASRS
ncbi:hypothetical protein BDR03DRAFT_650030 [Suillus americanus]|nr:hypothetical protein BDR03DRAFT_650030 [Suillus americanus]